MRDAKAAVVAAQSAFDSADAAWRRADTAYGTAAAAVPKAYDVYNARVETLREARAAAVSAGNNAEDRRLTRELRDLFTAFQAETETLTAARAAAQRAVSAANDARIAAELQLQDARLALHVAQAAAAR